MPSEGRTRDAALVTTQVLDSVRRRLGPRARSGIRRLTDPVLSPLIGSIRSARSAQNVAVTFDDGPDGEVSPLILDLLAEREAHATFFVLADQVERYPHLTRRMVREGHEIALHGADHRRVSTMSRTQASAYLRSARTRVEAVAGVALSAYRPPYGSQSLRSYLAARDCGLDVVVWSADAADWVDRPVTQVARDALAGVGPGGILLLHERLEPDLPRAAPTTSFDRPAMVRLVLDGLQKRGLSVVSVAELASTARMQRTAWFRP